MAIFLGFVGLAILVLGIIAVVRGHVDWARIGNRKVGSGVLAGGLIVFVIGALLQPQPQPTDTSGIAAPATTTVALPPSIVTTTPAPVVTTTPPPVTTTTTTTATTTTTVPRTHAAVHTTATKRPTHTVQTTKAVPPPPPHTTKAAPALTCSASMSDSTPADNSAVEVRIHTTAGARVTATAHYKTTTTSHSATASSSTVSIEFQISRATPGRPVPVDVTVSAHGQTGHCATSFVPH